MPLPFPARRLACVVLVALVAAATGGSATAAINPSALARRGQPSILSQADVERLSADASKRSIIILKNQHPEAPPRVAAGQRSRAVDSDQAPIRGELSQLNARDVRSFHLVNAVAATISQAEIDNLATNPAVQAIVPDAARRFTSRRPSGSGGPAAVAAPTTDAAAAQPICPSNPAVPLLEPEALQVMNVEFQPGIHQPAAHDLVDGTGIKVGILAGGLDPNNPDLQRDGHSVVFDYQDFSGFGNNAQTDGAESFLDASMIAAQGHQSYDLGGFVNPAYPLPGGCTIRLKGVAPGVTLAVMNLQGSAGGFFDSTVIQGIERAVEDDVDVLNESIGGNPLPDTLNDPVQLANAAAVAAGIVVVASTGDAGPTSNIGSPATGSGVIAAAGTTTYRIYRQTTHSGSQLSPGGWLSNNISAVSSSGTSEFGLREPDVAAPGDSGWILCSADTRHFTGCANPEGGSNPPALQAEGGTSMACSLVAGTAALVIQAYQQSHHGQSPAPELVKRIIVSTASDLGAPADHQGAGLVNSLKAVQMAMSTSEGPGRGTPTGNGLLVSQPNLSFVGRPEELHSFSLQVTNTGTSTQKLTPSLVRISPRPVSTETGTLTLSGGSPSFVDGEGNTNSFERRQFTVPPQADYLNGDVVWNGQEAPSAVFETLFDPLGRVAAYSVLGNAGSGRAHVEVRQPVPGTWTAILFTPTSSQAYAGDVQFSFTTQRFEAAGSVSPDTRMLRPGQTATLDVDVRDLRDPGDHVNTLRLTTGAPDDGSIPVVVRTLVRLDDRGGSFDGTLTGGAVAGLSGERQTYQFDVPRGAPSLNAAVQLRDENYYLTGFLTDPTGMPRDIQSTAALGPGGAFEGIGRTMQFFSASPAPGRWTLSLLVAAPIDGAHLNEPFTTRIDFKPASVVAHGLPQRFTTALAAGQPITATVDVVNTGNSNKDFFADARVVGPKKFLPLLGADVNNVPLPLPLDAQPSWLVPSDTDRLLVAAQSSVPIVLEVRAFNGDPDRLGLNLGSSFSLAAVTAREEILPGLFFALPEPVGPFGPDGLPGGTVNLAAFAETTPFDTSVTSDTGDAWLTTVDPDAAYTPLTLRPGQSGTITLTFTPGGPPGSLVRGVIAIDTFSLDTFSGDEIVLLPYTYRVR